MRAHVALMPLLVLIELFLRLGYIVPDDEPDYVEIQSRLHGRFRYELW